MLYQGIKLAFLIVMGFVVSIGAKIKIRITKLEPWRAHVFKGDVIRLKCVASDGEKNAFNVTWYYDNENAPAITNSTNNTNIVTWKKDNMTISIFSEKVDERSKAQWLIGCKAKSKGDSEFEHEVFKYVPDNDIPRITVSIPQTQVVESGTRRHALRCNVASNVKLKKLSIKWLFGGKTLSEKMIEDTNNVENIWLLQCLTEKDLGNYTCVAITTKYDVKWSDSRVTLLTGEFNVSGGLKKSAWTSLYIAAFVLTSLWRTFL